MSPVKVFKSTRSHPTQLLNASLRHFSQETIDLECLTLCSVCHGNIGGSSDKGKGEPHKILKKNKRLMIGLMAMDQMN